MLHDFIASNREVLVARCKAKAMARSSSNAAQGQLAFGVPLFLDQLVDALQEDRVPGPKRSMLDSADRASSVVCISARRHGRELFEHGYTMAQVIQDYGDVCQTVTDLALESSEVFNVEEFATLNRCLDEAMAGAATEYSSRRDAHVTANNALDADEPLGSLLPRLRGLADQAQFAITAIKARNISLIGATGAILERSLNDIRQTIDSSYPGAWQLAGVRAHRQLIDVAGFIAQMASSASSSAAAVGCDFAVASVEKGLAVYADKNMLFAAVGNILQNAFRYTRPQTQVSMSARGSGDRILIDISEHCGGLPAGTAERMFQPDSDDASANPRRDLGLLVSRSLLETNHGQVSVRNVPGTGCVFTINLPRKALH